MTFAFAIITLGILLVDSGWTGRTIAEVLQREHPTTTTTDTLSPTPIQSLTPAGLPRGLGVMDGHPVALWILPILRWARKNGWQGSVTSGYRTFNQQEQAAANYGLGHYGPSGPQASNHRKINYPGGAVDVTQAAQLASVLNGYPGSPKLVWGGPVIGDTVHFSATGH